MRRTQIAEPAFQLITRSKPQTYVCRPCLARANREFHKSARQNIDPNSFFGRMQNSLFGSSENKEKKEKEKKELQAKKEEQAKAQKDAAPEICVIEGQQYQVAKVVDPAVNKDYTPATTIVATKKIPRVGSERWKKRLDDKRLPYTGFAPVTETRLEDAEYKEIVRLMAKRVMREAREQQSNSASSTQGTVLPTAWQSVELSSEHKFTILRRILKSNGHRVPDHIITKAQTAGDLYDALKSKEVKELNVMKEIRELPNVEVRARHNPMLAHKEVGRYKLIVQAKQASA